MWQIASGVREIKEIWSIRLGEQLPRQSCHRAVDFFCWLAGLVTM